ncbi:hypothetical protein Aperf_G00000027193 [Anoplocephala perfoliata]
MAAFGSKMYLRVVAATYIPQNTNAAVFIALREALDALQIASMKSDARQGYLTSPSDPTLHQKEMGLKRAMNSLQQVARSMISDPEVLPLVDPAATVLKVGWREMPVNSDEEALRSYLVPSGSTGSDSAPASWDGQPLSGPMPQQPPPVPSGGLRGSFGMDTEGGEIGSGYPGGEVPAPYGSPFAPFPESDLNPHQFGGPAAHLQPGNAPAPTTHGPPPTSLPSLQSAPNNFGGTGADDEDFRPHAENSGYEPADVYGFQNPLRPEATPSAWPNQPPGAPTHWDTEPDTSEEGSGSEPIGGGGNPWDVKASPDLTGAPQPVQPVQPSAQQPPVASGGSDSAGAGLVVGEVGKLDIPDQIWVPEYGGVEQDYPGSSNPRATTTSRAVAFAPSLFLTAVSFLLLRR